MMLTEPLLALLAFGPQLIWGTGLLITGRIREQPALTAFLTFSGLTGAILLLGSEAGLITSIRAYSGLYLANEIGSQALLAAALLELVTLCLYKHPKYQRAGGKAVRRLLVVCALAILGIAVLPTSLLNTAREFHLAERSATEISLGLAWFAFLLASQYLYLPLTKRIFAEGSLLAGLFLGYAALQLWEPSWWREGVCVWSAICHGAGAVLTFAPGILQGPPESSRDNRRSEAVQQAQVRDALARLDFLDRSLDATGK